jgi:hypothetical protein
MSRRLVLSCGWVKVGRDVRVRVEIMGSQKCRTVGKSQSVFDTINPVIFTRTRIIDRCSCS